MAAIDHQTTTPTGRWMQWVRRVLRQTSQRPPATGRPAATKFDSYSRWPVIILSAAAAVSIWGGWVELGRMAGFGPVNLLPGITNLEVDLSITLPIGMETYAAWAMGAWLTKKSIDPAARAYAKWSTFVSLAIGMSGQVAYHLLSAAGVERAPWPVVVGVASVSVAVLGMASMLAHRLHVPAERPATPGLVDQPPAEPVGQIDVDVLLADLDMVQPAAAPDSEDRPAGRKRRPVTADERATIVQLSESLSEREVARRMKRSRDTVRRVLQEAGASESASEAPVAARTTQTWPVGAAA
ncbi:helix-turn-helix domain-containing protein [Agromyces sp. GXQ0307]|uniref:helix-turn-helix domain-containing protein n=1 Tax=Agromyces sp. GXQ0307 TaxID=3377835 RepID=UPI00383AA1D3